MIADRLRRLQPAPPQIRRHHRSALVQLAKRDRPQLVVFFVNLNVAAPWFAAPAQSQNLAQRFRFANLLFNVWTARRRSRASRS